MAALDMTCCNPWSRLTLSEYANLHCLRETLRRQLHGARAVVARSMLIKPVRSVVKATTYAFHSVVVRNTKFQRQSGYSAES